MFTKPSAGDMLEGVVIALQKDVLPELGSQKAQVVVVMAQAILESVRQRIPVELQIMAMEHNEMTATLRDIAGILGESAGPEADRVRERAKTLGSRDDIAPIPAMDEVTAAYFELSSAVRDSLNDLDVLIREGNTAAEEALTRLRAHLGPRVVRDFTTHVVGAGMAGRG